MSKNRRHGHVQPQATKWFGTIWHEEDLNLCKQLANDPRCTYLIISALDHTKGDHNGPLDAPIACDHFHVFYQLSTKRVHLQTKNAHWEIPRSITGANRYCQEKGEPTLLHGEISINMADKADWGEFVEHCKLYTPKQMIDGPFSKLYARFRMFAGEVRNQYRQLDNLNGELQNEWYWGIAGSGKSSKAYIENPGAYWKNPNKWWDGYNNEDVVVIDDWGPQHEVLAWHLKVWADRYPFNAETKGSSMFIRPKKIIITSNYSIDQCFKNDEDIEAFKRRFKVTHFTMLKKWDDSSSNVIQPDPPLQQIHYFDELTSGEDSIVSEEDECTPQINNWDGNPDAFKVI